MRLDDGAVEGRGPGAEDDRSADAGSDERLRRALYQRGARPHDVEVFLAHHDRAEADPVPAPAGPGAVAPPPEPAASAPSRVRQRRALVVPVVLLLAGLGGGALLQEAARPAPAPSPAAPAAPSLQQRVVGSRGALTAADAFRFEPDGLPARWRAVSVAAEGRRLQGAAVLRVEPATSAAELLVVPVCATRDGRYFWSLTDDGDGVLLSQEVGPCGRLEGTPLRLPVDGRGRSMTLRISANGPVPFSVAVLQR